MYDKVEKIAQNNRIPLEFAALAPWLWYYIYYIIYIYVYVGAGLLKIYIYIYIYIYICMCIYIYLWMYEYIYICMNELNISMITILNFDYWWGADTFPISRFIIFAVRNYFTRCNTVVLFFSVTIILWNKVILSCVKMNLKISPKLR